MTANPVEGGSMNEYPSRWDLRKIRRFDFQRKSVKEFLDLINLTWNHHYGRAWKGRKKFKLATGGWSGNEEIIQAMIPTLFWISRWELSRAGGYYEFDMGDL